MSVFDETIINEQYITGKGFQMMLNSKNKFFYTHSKHQYIDGYGPTYYHMSIQMIENVYYGSVKVHADMVYYESDKIILNDNIDVDKFIYYAEHLTVNDVGLFRCITVC